MRAARALTIWTIALVVALFVLIAGYRRLFWPGRLKHEADLGAREFYERQDLYKKLLDSWITIQTEKCGKLGTTSGFVAFDSITREQDGSFSLALIGSSYSRLSTGELAKRLNAKPDVVRAAMDTLSLVGSKEIIQSGDEVKVVSLENDTRGYLHIDQLCPDAATVAFWSTQPGNFKADNPGHFVGLKSLGDGWYYYIEQR